MLVVGSEIGRYRIDDVLGRGGMGVVYRAFDHTLGRRVALKVVAEGAGPDEVARLVREARAAAALAHPNIVVVHDVGELEGVAFVAMELVQGKPLRSFVGDASVPMERRLAWLSQIARALASAHRAGIVHRDVKPENVIVRDDDDAVKVVDFGIARVAQSPGVSGDAPTERLALGTLTERGATIGTPLYMAPEQLRGDAIDARVDQFAWGVMAYELLSGRYPWRVENIVQLAASIASTAPQPLRSTTAPGIAPHVETVVLRALSADPERRFDSLDAIASILDPTTGPRSSGPLSFAETALVPVPSRGSARSRRPWILGVGLAALLAGGGWFALRQRPSVTSPPASAPPAASSAAAVAPTVFGMLDAPMPPTKPDALAAYRQGLGAMRHASWPEARRHFERAVTLDPELGAAHLRRAHIELFGSPGSDVARTSFREARRLEEQMLPRDRSFLEALAPAFADPPSRIEASERLARLSEASPGDAEIAAAASAFAFQRTDYPRSLALSDRAVTADPGYADAWQQKAIAHAATGDWGHADAALDRCLAAHPAALDCKVERSRFLAARGRCAEIETHARSVLSEIPRHPVASLLLGAALFAKRESRGAVLGAVLAGTEGMPPDAVPFHKGRFESAVAVLDGDFEGAAQIAGRARAALTSRDRNAFDSLALTEALALVESGAKERASRIASDHVAATRSMAAPSFDVAPILRGIAGEAAEKPVVPFGDRVLPHAAWGIWAWPQATDEARAKELVAARPPLGAIRNHRSMSGALHAFEGRVFQLAGRLDEARPILEMATRTCHAIDEPFASTWAHLWLGELLEAKGEKDAACKAYAVVTERWGKAKKSVSADKAAKASKRLRCP